jgi:hypothetical protein
VSAVEIYNIFGTEVFDTVWGNTLKKVKNILHKGKVEKHVEIIQFLINIDDLYSD